ncbi:hypothetical protein E2C01_062216 [Portunus trituberculatus]|uniref:Uncharacterized protein n=1 Tax=Portunus trituberculatus TaxID=210409 RepID=A0A5B7HDF4_PORTR|nr:hypothetical protein [Portunus trituberculatus]
MLPVSYALKIFARLYLSKKRKKLRKKKEKTRLASAQLQYTAAAKTHICSLAFVEGKGKYWKPKARQHTTDTTRLTTAQRRASARHTPQPRHHRLTHTALMSGRRGHPEAPHGHTHRRVMQYGKARHRNRRQM